MNLWTFSLREIRRRPGRMLLTLTSIAKTQFIPGIEAAAPSIQRFTKVFVRGKAFTMLLMGRKFRLNWAPRCAKSRV